jgi:hydroxyacylglutathione hydrolase
MSRLEIHQFMCLTDNFGVLLREPHSNTVAAVDAPETAPIVAALEAKGWQLTHILTTHHHRDHTDGNLDLKSMSGCTIVGPRGEADKVRGIDRKVGEGDTFKLGDVEVRVLDTPGHTAGHIAYWMPGEEVVFVGDTLFSVGCGRVIEGNPQQMWQSLDKLRRLPPATRIYCGHEYTEANIRFALTIEPDNKALQARASQVKALREKGAATLPTTMGAELATNPFLRPQEQGIRMRLGMQNAPDWQVFAEIRERKNRS